MVDSSRQDEFVLLRCIHHKKEPWPSRRLDTTATHESRIKRDNTKFGGKGCLHSIRIGHVLVNQRYKNGPRHWTLKVHGECIHPLCPDPISYQSHRARRPEVQAAIEASIDLIREGYTYCKAGKVLALSQLKIKKQAFYNLRAQLDLNKELFKDRANGIKEALTELGYD